MTRSRIPRRGVTLVELLLTLVIIAAISAVTSLAVRIIEKPRPTDPAQMLSDSAHAAVAESRSITIAAEIAGVSRRATIAPDGSVTADSAFGIERLTGRAINAP